MFITELLSKIDGKTLTACTVDMDTEIRDLYICDLLSWVMSHAKKGDAWITILTNVNVPAVAVLTEVACVIIPEDIQVEELTLKKANENGVVIISTKYNSFEISKKIVEAKLI
jgi:predicted transcriptional regulator